MYVRIQFQYYFFKDKLSFFTIFFEQKVQIRSSTGLPWYISVSILNGKFPLHNGAKIDGKY